MEPTYLKYVPSIYIKQGTGKDFKKAVSCKNPDDAEKNSLI
jgi:hypothetical protein